MADGDLVAVVTNGRLAEVDIGAEEFLATEQEVPRVPLGVKADEIAAEQTAEHRFAHARREESPLVGTGPRNMREVVDEQVGPRRANHLGHEIEVVVVHHDDAARRDVVEVGDGAREAAIHRDVAVDPRVPLRVVMSGARP